MSTPQQPYQQPSQQPYPQPYQQPSQQPYQQPGPQHPAQPGRPPGYGMPTGELVLELAKPFGAMGMISPVVTIDGYPAQCRWGRNSFGVPAGSHQLEVAQTYLWTYGRARTPVLIEPGRPSEIYYSGPMFTFGVGGAIGTQPQRRPGLGLFIGVMAFLAVLLLVGILAAIVGSS